MGGDNIYIELKHNSLWSLLSTIIVKTRWVEKVGQDHAQNFVD